MTVAARRRPFAVGVALMALLAALTTSMVMGADPAAASTQRSTIVAQTFEQAPCVVDVPASFSTRVRCGYLTVPERRGDGADPERTVRLPLTIIAPRSASPVPDPLVVPMAGGGLDAFRDVLRITEWQADREIVLVAPRGDASADPALDCPELDVANTIVDGARLTGSAYDAAVLRDVQRCHDRLVEDGIDPAAYTSAVNAADLADLRNALGYDTWNMYAVSSASRIALTTMRNHPDGLRSVILDGVSPPAVNLFEARPAAFVDAVAAVEAACDADEECGQRYPDLAETLGTVLDRAETEPIEVSAKSPADRSPVRVDLTDEDLVDALTLALAEADGIRALPFTIDQLARGNDSAALPLAQRLLDAPGTSGVAQSITCAEQVPFVDDDRLAEALAADPLGDHMAPMQGVRERCEAWAVPAADPAQASLVQSDIPVLLATGGYDPLTPTSWADAAAEGLPRHVAVVFPTDGHAPIRSSLGERCPSSIVAAFLEDPSAAPDVSCSADAAPTHFLTTADIQPSPALYHLDSDLVQDRDPVQLTIVIALLAALIATLFYGIGYAVSWLARRTGRAPEGTVLTAVLSATLNLAFAACIGVVLVRTDPLLLAFGLPAGMWPVLLLPFAALASTIVLVVLLVRAWLHGDGAPWHRVVLTLSALASLGFAVWLLVHGLLML